jgi:hypothetical protein
MRVIALLALLGIALAPHASRASGRPGFTLLVNQVRLYMTHYALFEEPDPSVPPGIYVDAATGQPTNELDLTAPCESFQFAYNGQPNTFEVSSSAPTKMLPYFVSPPGFPPLPAPAQVVGAIQETIYNATLQATGSGVLVDAATIAANTVPLLVAIGHFEPTPETISAQLVGNKLSLTRDVEFEVKVRVGFRFQPPVGLPVPPVGILTGWLTRGLVDFLIGLNPDPTGGDPTQVVYNWRSTMNLSTDNSYVRPTATEPPPVADPFPDGLATIDFAGQRIDDLGRYTIVGNGVRVPFDAPPELALFLFGTTVLTDVEFAVEESGVLIRNGD